MYKPLKFVHLLAFAVFLGSIPGHILLAALADQAATPADMAGYRSAVAALATGLTTPALGALFVTGLALAWKGRRQLMSKGWFLAKLVLVVALAVNGITQLTPLALDLAALTEAAAATGRPAESYAALKLREDILGAANLAMILAATALASLKPRRKSRHVTPAEAG